MTRDFTKLSKGIGQVSLGVMLKILTFLIALLISFVFAANPGPEILTGAPLLRILGTAGSFIIFIGVLFCLGAPPGLPNKALIYVSVVLSSMSVIVSLLPLFTALMVIFGIINAVINPTVQEELSRYVAFIDLVVFVLFLIYLRSVADFIDAPDLSRNALGLLKLGAVMVVVGVITGSFLLLPALFIAQGANPDPGGLTIIVLLGCLTLTVLLIIFLMRYALLLFGLKSALDRAGRGRDS
jgi:hypothetical protein